MSCWLTVVLRVYLLAQCVTRPTQVSSSHEMKGINRNVHRSLWILLGVTGVVWWVVEITVVHCVWDTVTVLLSERLTADWRQCRLEQCVHQSQSPVNRHHQYEPGISYRNTRLTLRNTERRNEWSREQERGEQPLKLKLSWVSESVRACHIPRNVLRFNCSLRSRILEVPERQIFVIFLTRSGPSVQDVGCNMFIV